MLPASPLSLSAVLVWSHFQTPFTDRGTHEFSAAVITRYDHLRKPCIMTPLPFLRMQDHTPVQSSTACHTHFARPARDELTHSGSRDQQQQLPAQKHSSHRGLTPVALVVSGLTTELHPTVPHARQTRRRPHFRHPSPPGPAVPYNPSLTTCLRPCHACHHHPAPPSAPHTAGSEHMGWSESQGPQAPKITTQTRHILYRRGEFVSSTAAISLWRMPKPAARASWVPCAAQTHQIHTCVRVHTVNMHGHAQHPRQGCRGARSPPWPPLLLPTADYPPGVAYPGRKSGCRNGSLHRFWSCRTRPTRLSQHPEAFMR